MEKIIRFGVSLPKELLQKFDSYIQKRKYENRSEAIRDLIREKLVNETWGEDKVTCAIISMIYDHHQRNLMQKLTDIQHDFSGNIISSNHVHIDHHNCLEVIIVKAKSSEIKILADKMFSTKGVLHGKLTEMTIGKEF